MIQTPSAPHRRATRSIGRADLLHSALQALEGARVLDELVKNNGADGRATALLARLDAHREILARRAANVALAPVVTADELFELRDAAQTLVAVRGWIARRLGQVGNLS